MTLLIEESVARDTQWAVFEPNEFLHTLFKQGAFVGDKPGEVYFVKCDRETKTQERPTQRLD